MDDDQGGYPWKWLIWRSRAVISARPHDGHHGAVVARLRWHRAAAFAEHTRRTLTGYTRAA
jgi:hypothetical protein